MKRRGIVGIALFLMIGAVSCSGPGWEEVKREGASYRDFHHMWFSIKKSIQPEAPVTDEDARRSEESRWFGDPVER
jgi:hypothetical protein